MVAAFVALILCVHTAKAEVGDDGLHKQDWFALTFKDIAEDIEDAASENKRLVLVFEQAGCIYCEKTHETVLSDPEVVDYVTEHFVVVQFNLWGSEEVTDLDGEVLTEKSAAEKWGVMFTPTWVFLPEQVSGNQSVKDAAIGAMPGAFGKGTFLDLFTWIYDKGYEGEESFQKYHNRMVDERRAATNG
ncbi:MAG: thioredoxin family protein [Pseudomonadota bacterium]